MVSRFILCSSVGNGLRKFDGEWAGSVLVGVAICCCGRYGLWSGRVPVRLQHVFPDRYGDGSRTVAGRTARTGTADVKSP